MTRLVILPGLDGTGCLVQEFIDALPSGWTATALRYPADCTDYTACTDWARRNLPSEPYFLVAESFSGPVALQLAAEQLPGLQGVAFVASFANVPRPWIALFWPIAFLFPLTHPFLIRLSLPMVMGRWRSAGFARRFQCSLAEVPSWIMARRLRAVAGVASAAKLAGAKVPMVYLQARADRLIPRAAAEPFGKVLLIDGPHFLLQARPEKCADAIARFVDGNKN